MLFSLLNNQPFCFWRDRNGNAAALFFCVIPAIAPNIEYIKIRLEKFNDVNQSQSNVVQILKLIFCYSER